MEDVAVVHDAFGGDPSRAFFAVYDGHGGTHSAMTAGRKLHTAFLDVLLAKADELASERAMSEEKTRIEQERKRFHQKLDKEKRQQVERLRRKKEEEAVAAVANEDGWEPIKSETATTRMKDGSAAVQRWQPPLPAFPVDLPAPPLIIPTSHDPPMPSLPMPDPPMPSLPPDDDTDDPFGLVALELGLKSLNDDVLVKSVVQSAKRGAADDAFGVADESDVLAMLEQLARGEEPSPTASLEQSMEQLKVLAEERPLTPPQPPPHLAGNAFDSVNWDGSAWVPRRPPAHAAIMAAMPKPVSSIAPPMLPSKSASGAGVSTISATPLDPSTPGSIIAPRKLRKPAPEIAVPVSPEDALNAFVGEGRPLPVPRIEDLAHMDVLRAFLIAFRSVEAELLREDHTNDGSTATVFFLRGRMLFYANVGDSNAVLVRDGAAVMLTAEHNVNSNVSEQKRLSAAGARLLKDRRGHVRVFEPKSRIVLAVSRSLGDLAFKHLLPPESVTCRPHVGYLKLKPSDSTLIIASDGVWDVMTPQEAADLVSGIHSCQKAADELLAEALDRRSGDNVSCVVVRF